MRKHFPTSKIRIISIITLYIQGNKLFECSSDIVRSGYPYRYGTCGLIDKTPNPGIAIGQKERRNNLTSRKKCTAICTSDAGTPIWRSDCEPGKNNRAAIAIAALFIQSVIGYFSSSSRSARRSSVWQMDFFAGLRPSYYRISLPVIP